MTANRKIRVFICDDHAILRSGLRALFSGEPDIELAGEAGTAEELLKGWRSPSPDVVVMDIRLPGMDGLEATRQLRNKSPKTKVVILTMHAEAPLLMSAINAGASGYVLKSDLYTELVRTIREVAHGREMVYSNHTEKILGQLLAGRGTQTSGAELSEQELKVVSLTAQGYSSKQIAERLSISVSTVDTYRMRATNKLGLNDRAELFRWAKARGLDH